jgi:hypothetical protein
MAFPTTCPDMSISSDTVWALAIPVGLLVIGGFFKGVVRRELFAWRNFHMGMELCVATVVECFAYMGELARKPTIPGGTMTRVAEVFAMSLAFLFIVTALHARFDPEAKETGEADGPSKLTFTALFVMANLLGIIGLAVVLSSRG